MANRENALGFRYYTSEIPIDELIAKINTLLGPYFTYVVGSKHESAIRWEDAANPISELRDMIQTLILESSIAGTFELEELTVLAWHGQGSRKVALF